MKRKILSLLIIAAFFSVHVGCETAKEHKGAATGAAIGAATGAVGGAVLGSSKTKAAIIGGLLGALVGGAIGHYAYDKKRTREETAQRYAYHPSTGTMIRIEEASALPNTVRPGDKVDLKVTYAVLNAAPESQESITEIREIRHQGQLVGRPEVTITRQGGTYSSDVPIYLPSDAKPYGAGPGEGITETTNPVIGLIFCTLTFGERSPRQNGSESHLTNFLPSLEI